MPGNDWCDANKLSLNAEEVQDLALSPQSKGVADSKIPVCNAAITFEVKAT